MVKVVHLVTVAHAQLSAAHPTKHRVQHLPCVLHCMLCIATGAPSFTSCTCLGGAGGNKGCVDIAVHDKHCPKLVAALGVLLAIDADGREACWAAEDSI